WMMHPDDFGSLVGAVDTAGSLAIQSLSFSPPSLFGRPVVLNPDLPAPAANAKSLVFGDFSKAYAVRRVADVSLQRQVEILSDSGQIGYRAAHRVDGRPLLASAAVIVQHSAT